MSDEQSEEVAKISMRRKEGRRNSLAMPQPDEAELNKLLSKDPSQMSPAEAAAAATALFSRKSRG